MSSSLSVPVSQYDNYWLRFNVDWQSDCRRTFCWHGLQSHRLHRDRWRHRFRCWRQRQHSSPRRWVDYLLKTAENAWRIACIYTFRFKKVLPGCITSTNCSRLFISAAWNSLPADIPCTTRTQRLKKTVQILSFSQALLGFSFSVVLFNST